MKRNAVILLVLFGLLALAAACQRMHRQGISPEAGITTRWIPQPVDHASPHGEKFRQEVMVLAPPGVPPDAPVFFILGNESDATAEKLRKLYEAYGAPPDVVFIQAEHRGYGQSLTQDPDQSLPAYVRIDQALADYHRVREALNETFPGPWMAAGYSYGGALAINYARDYPEDVRVVLVSSGVVHWPFATDHYDRAVRARFGPALYGRIAGHVAHLKPAEPLDDIWLEREFLLSLIKGLSQYQRYQSLMVPFRILSCLPTPAFIKTLRWLDGAFAGGRGWEAALALGKRGLRRDEAATGKFQWYTFKYQQCFQVGLHWVSEAPGGVFPSSRQELVEECRRQFGALPAAAAGSPWAVHAMVKGLSVPQVYVGGGRDPWQGLCLDPETPLSNGRYIFVPDGYHCPDRDDPALGRRVLAAMRDYLPKNALAGKE